MKTVAILDYGIGNVKSMLNACENVGSKAILTSDREIIMQADAMILPGVGAFKHGMDNLNERNLAGLIHEFVNSGKPFLGVCLGMQMLLEESEEFGSSQGLGLIKGKVIRMPLPLESKDKLPHVSWNELLEPAPGRWKNTILQETPIHTDVYFVHSFVAVPDDPADALATCSYGDVTFCAAVHRNNVYGTQFHPEKSGEKGLQILQQFIQRI